MDKGIKSFTKGIYNLIDDEIIPESASSDSQNWITKNGRIILVNGKERLGTEGVAGKITGEIFGYKTDGSKVHWRKKGTKIQYFDGTTWQDTITGLTLDADYSFTNHSSLAGTFTFAIGIDGIYKMNNANPQSYCAMYDSAINHKGLAFINKGRMILWNNPNNKTNIYGSHLDLQNILAGYYTSVASEATTSLTGTLAFKASGATRNCFNVRITLTGTGEVFTEGAMGTFVGSLGGTGTINYITGAYTLSNAGVGTASYQWEDSNINGITDFSASSTRLATESFYLPQDVGGDAILNVLVGEDGRYYSVKKQSIYSLEIAEDDLKFNNQVYRIELGVPSYRSAIAMQYGIVFLNTANKEKPELTILEKNPIGGQVTPKILFTQFKFSNYEYDDCTIDTYDRYILIACKTKNATTNDTILMCDIPDQTVSIAKYAGRTFAKSDGDLFMGSSITETVYKIFNGFDDNGSTIENYWIGRGEMLGTENLKKFRYLRLLGQVSANQSYEVYMNFDNSGEQLVGTVLGSGSYVDKTSPQTIGSNLLGEIQIGGSDSIDVYNYICEIKLIKIPKFRKFNISFKALSYGYVDINGIIFNNISVFEGKIPSRFRQKQNVGLDGIHILDTMYLTDESLNIIVTENGEKILITN